MRTRARPQAFNVVNLQWAVGVLCSAMGALMLVAPHQFAPATYTVLQGQLWVWGLAFLQTGIFLLAVIALAPGSRLTALAHLVAGGAMLVLAAGFARTGTWSGASGYFVLGLGTLVAPFLTRSGPSRATLPDAFTLLVGLGALISGAVLLLTPADYSAARYDLVRPFLGWIGLAFAASGLLLCVGQTGRLRTAVRRWAGVPLGLGFLLFGAFTSLRTLDWVGGLYYGGVGLALLLMSALGTQWQGGSTLAPDADGAHPGGRDGGAAGHPSVHVCPEPGGPGGVRATGAPAGAGRRARAGRGR